MNPLAEEREERREISSQGFEELRENREKRVYSRRQDPIVQNSQPPCSLNVSGDLERQLSDGCREPFQEFGDASFRGSRVGEARSCREGSIGGRPSPVEREVEALTIPHFLHRVEIVRWRRSRKPCWWSILEEGGRWSSGLSPEPSGTKGSDESWVGRDEVDIEDAGSDRFARPVDETAHPI